MHSYLVTVRPSTQDRLVLLAGLAEALLGRPLTTGATVRNIAVMPRTGHLHVHIDADDEDSVIGLMQDYRLQPASLSIWTHNRWGHLMACAVADDEIDAEIEEMHAGVVERIAV